MDEHPHSYHYYQPTMGTEGGVKRKEFREIPRVAQAPLTRADVGTTTDFDAPSRHVLADVKKATPVTLGPEAAPHKKPMFVHDGKLMTYKGSVWQKLCDPALYTGSHRYRFDEHGRGRGVLGRTTSSLAAQPTALLKGVEPSPSFYGADRNGELWQRQLRCDLHEPRAATLVAAMETSYLTSHYMPYVPPIASAAMPDRSAGLMDDAEDHRSQHGQTGGDDVQQYRPFSPGRHAVVRSNIPIGLWSQRSVQVPGVDYEAIVAAGQPSGEAVVTVPGGGLADTPSSGGAQKVVFDAYALTADGRVVRDIPRTRRMMGDDWVDGVLHRTVAADTPSRTATTQPLDPRSQRVLHQATVHTMATAAPTPGGVPGAVFVEEGRSLHPWERDELTKLERHQLQQRVAGGYEQLSPPTLSSPMRDGADWGEEEEGPPVRLYMDALRDADAAARERHHGRPSPPVPHCASRFDDTMRAVPFPRQRRHFGPVGGPETVLSPFSATHGGGGFSSPQQKGPPPLASRRGGGGSGFIEEEAARRVASRRGQPSVDDVVRFMDSVASRFASPTRQLGSGAESPRQRW